MNNNDDQQLGANVTDLARSKGKVESAVISVRLGSQEVSRLEALGRRSGRTVSQVIRDAIAAYEVVEPQVAVACWNGTQISIGESRLLGWVGIHVDQETNEIEYEEPSGTFVWPSGSLNRNPLPNNPPAVRG